MAKVRITQGGEDARMARAGILAGLDALLRLLHPLMPFLTEEVASYLPLKRGMIASAPWPKVEDYQVDAAAEEEFEQLQQIVTAVRNLRSEMNVPPGRAADVTLRADGNIARVAQEQEPLLKSLAKIAVLSIGPALEKPGHAASALVGDAELYVHLEGLIDLDAERKRLRKELEKTEKFLASVNRKLANQDFLEKAKPQVIEAERVRLSTLETSLEKLRKGLAALDG